MRVKNGTLIMILFVAFLLTISCGYNGDENSNDMQATDDDDTSHNGDNNDSGDDDDDSMDDDDSVNDDDDDDTADDDDYSLEDLFEEMGFLRYLEFEPYRTEELENGYTRYFFDTDDFRCYLGDEANVAVWHGTSNNVLFFMEGGGASWPGFYGGIEIDHPGFGGYKSQKEKNPLKGWSIVYVPYRDSSLHAGDNEYQQGPWNIYHHGLRHTTAAAALAKSLFPDPEKVLVAGVSAGGFGAFAGWPIVKSQYMDTDTYVLNDSGIGVWNPDRPETFELMKGAWNLPIPDACVKCQEGTVLTWVLELALKLDPHLRVGVYSSYRDILMSAFFLRMWPVGYENLIMNVTGQIKASYPDSVARFFRNGYSHTIEMSDEGGDYEIDGISVYDWVSMLVNDDPDWDDLLE
jgi:Pectinacetylesterase